MSKLATVALLSALTACLTAPDRATPGDFTPYRQTRISPGDVPAFTDCIMDGFARATWIGSSLTVRQQRRAAGFRIETSLDGHPAAMTSADVFDDGRVEMHERARFEMLGERAAFAACLAQFPTTG